jgi:hypothetical protein
VDYLKLAKTSWTFGPWLGRVSTRFYLLTVDAWIWIERLYADIEDKPFCHPKLSRLQELRGLQHDVHRLNSIIVIPARLFSLILLMPFTVEAKDDFDI